MWRLIKALLVLGVLGFAGLVGYAYVADLAPDSAEVKVPVILNAE
jgi:predicted small integral membrane protein